MRKNKIVYGIFAGKVLLPFLIRGTKKEAIRAFGEWSATFPTWKAGVNAGYSVQKLRVELAKKSK